MRAFVKRHCPRLAIMDGTLFGNIFDQETIDTVLVEMGTLLRSPYRILRKRAVEFLDALLPGFTLSTTDLWTDIPEGSKKSLSLGEFTALSSSIMAEVYLWLALRDDKSAILGANVYDIRPTSLDARAFLEAAADRGCPIVLQCSSRSCTARFVARRFRTVRRWAARSARSEPAACSIDRTSSCLTRSP